MKLVSCHIENFGKLQNFDYSFDGEKSIIHEDNGWGKSTLATFIRVMFYGFIGENKRTIIDNERKKFRPWQMGTYGGSIVFSVNDKEYRMERRFGEKKSGTDEFVLYDNKTNLSSNDYSTNIGEELFGIDLESFMRTVFIAQQDCGTEVTPNISAKIGNVSDQTADMGNYDAVQSSLKKEMDRLTPDRATGQLKKMTDHISELQEKVRNKEYYTNNISELANKLEEQVTKKEHKLNELQNVQNELERVSAIKDSLAGAERYKELCEQEKDAKETHKEITAFFPNGVPAKSSVEEAIKRCDNYEDFLQTAKNFTLTDEENRKLVAFEEEFSRGMPDEHIIKDAENNIDSLYKLEAERDAGLLSETERRKLEEAEKLFANYQPSIEEIDNLSAQWGDKKSKKEALSAKRVNAELFKNNITNNAQGGTNKTIGVVLIVVGIIAFLCGIIMIVAANNMTVGGGVAAIGAIAAIIGVVLSVPKGKENSNSTDNPEYIRMLDDIARDEEFIRNVEEACEDLFTKMGIPYNEYNVPVELNRFRGLIKDYCDLADRNDKEGSAERESRIRDLTDKIIDFLNGYKFDTDTADYQKAIYQLKNDISEYSRIKTKEETRQRALDEGTTIGNEIKDYLKSLGFEAEDNIKNQLSEINEKCISFEYSKDNLEKITSKKTEFENENDVSKYAESVDTSENVSLEELNRTFNSLNDEIDKISGLEDDFRNQMDEVSKKLEDVENDEAELVNLQEDYAYALRKYQIISKTKDYLEKAKQNFSSKYMDDIKESFEKYHNMISNSDEKYELDANLNIKLKEKGGLHEIEHLSEGYKDLVGLCRRMAMVDAMYDLEKPFLILDDPFVNLDESRLAGAMKFLENLEKEYQIIYFSCHQSRCG